jgi:hypothetical protein
MTELHHFTWDIAADKNYDDEDDSGGTMLDERDEIAIKFTYPLRKPVTMTFTSPGGFTRDGFCRAVSAGYRTIYEGEEKSRTTLPEPRGMLLNRSETDGVYGIWGHDIGDLVIEQAYLNESGIWQLAVGS